MPPQMALTGTVSGPSRPQQNVYIYTCLGIREEDEAQNAIEHMLGLVIFIFHLFK